MNKCSFFSFFSSSFLLSCLNQLLIPHTGVCAKPRSSRKSNLHALARLIGSQNNSTLERKFVMFLFKKLFFSSLIFFSSPPLPQIPPACNEGQQVQCPLPKLIFYLFFFLLSPPLSLYCSLLGRLNALKTFYQTVYCYIIIRHQKGSVCLFNCV